MGRLRAQMRGSHLDLAERFSVSSLSSSFLMDTWQYFWHRFFHTNRFLYRHIHSIHHRLYCPYSFGALYNHPIEGFMLDTLGTAVAHACSLMTTRQAILLFGISTLKTVDDHCGCEPHPFPLSPAICVVPCSSRKD